MSVSTEPTGEPVSISSANSNLKVTKAGNGYELSALNGQRDSIELSAQSGQCPAQTFQIDVLPNVVNDLWNFPLVGDPEADDVNEAYEYMIEKCTSDSQNPINHSIDGCSGPAPQRITESSFVTNMQLEVFDKFRPGFEPKIQTRF